MKEVLLLKCGENVLKGLNRKTFEDRLLKKPQAPHGARCGLRDFHASVGRLCGDPGRRRRRRRHGMRKPCFGFATISRAAVCPEKDARERHCDRKGLSRGQFRGGKDLQGRDQARRQEVPDDLDRDQPASAATLADLFPEVRPDMHHPDLVVNVEMRESMPSFMQARSRAQAACRSVPERPRGAALSGGIDSPVAGWMMAKRGLGLSASTSSAIRIPPSGPRKRCSSSAAS